MPMVLRVGSSGAVEEVSVSSAAPSSAVVAFGSVPQRTQLGTIAHAGATVGQRVIASEDGESDESEMEPLALAAWVSAADVISVRASTLNAGGAFTGNRRINYAIG